MSGIWFSLAFSAVVLLLYLRERSRSRKTLKDLKYINNRLAVFTDRNMPLTGERLLAVTGEPELRRLLLGINELLDRAGQSASDYARTEQAMRRMLSNVSHDLKTPLTVIMGYAEVLDQSPDLTAEERQKMLNQIYRKTAEVHERINAFFDLSRLEADDYDIPLSVVDATEVCRHRILAYYDLLAERGFEVRIDIPEQPAWIYANGEALSRILDNLLSNAVRYGAEGRYIGVFLVHSGDKVEVSVEDRGRGIPAAYQDKVFERMYTLEDSRNRSLQGSGLGLAIVKRLTERLGGRIRLESEPGIRTRFILTFPASSYVRNT